MMLIICAMCSLTHTTYTTHTSSLYSPPSLTYTTLYLFLTSSNLNTSPPVSLSLSFVRRDAVQ